MAANVSVFLPNVKRPGALSACVKPTGEKLMTTIKKATREGALKALKNTDWQAIDAMTDEDIAAQVASNPDAALLPVEIDVKAIRATSNLSQVKFARMFGIKPATLRNWEQGRTTPEGPARALLTIIKNDPEAAFKALQITTRS